MNHWNLTGCSIRWGVSSKGRVEIFPCWWESYIYTSSTIQSCKDAGKQAAGWNPESPHTQLLLHFLREQGYADEAMSIWRVVVVVTPFSLVWPSVNHGQTGMGGSLPAAPHYQSKYPSLIYNFARAKLFLIIWSGSALSCTFHLASSA